jgi:hypothetical protein
MSAPEKPANDVAASGQASQAKSFGAGGIIPQEDDKPLVIYTTQSGCSPS